MGNFRPLEAAGRGNRGHNRFQVDENFKYAMFCHVVQKSDKKGQKDKLLNLQDLFWYPV